MLNVSLAGSSKFAGLNIAQALELFGEAGIQMPLKRNFEEQTRKMEEAILKDLEKQVMINREATVKAVLDNQHFNPETDILVWHDADGNMHETVKILTMCDGAGANRSYAQKATGTQFAVNMFAKCTQQMVGFKNSRTGCWKCTNSNT